jgi:hypothetical protein
MLRRFASKRRIAAAVSVIAVLAVAGAAYAYFTASGTGTGTGSVGMSANTITVVGTETAALTPGGPGGTVLFTASNGSNFNQRLTNIHLASITPDSGHASCSTVVGGANPDFTMPDVPVGSDGDLAPNASGATLTEAGTLSMNDTGVKQDACEGATLTLTFTTT